MNTPAELKYSKDHEWVRVDGNIAFIGITDFAQDQLGDIVYVDIEVEEGVVEIYTTPEDFSNVRDHLIEKGYDIEEAEITLFPQTYAQLDEEQKEKVMELVNMLEDNEDAQDVHHNLEVTE